MEEDLEISPTLLKIDEDGVNFRPAFDKINVEQVQVVKQKDNEVDDEQTQNEIKQLLQKQIDDQKSHLNKSYETAPKPVLDKFNNAETLSYSVAKLPEIDIVNTEEKIFNFCQYFNMKMHQIDSHRGNYLDGDQKPKPMISARNPHNIDAVSISEKIDRGIMEL